MAVFMVESTAVQDLAMQFLVAGVNADRSRQVPPLAPLTVEEYVEARMRAVFASWANDYESQIIGATAQAWSGITSNSRATILKLLGLAGFGALSVPEQLVALQALAAARFRALSADDQNTIISLLGV